MRVFDFLNFDFCLTFLKLERERERSDFGEISRAERAHGIIFISDCQTASNGGAGVAGGQSAG